MHSLDDDSFDGLLPKELRRLSRAQWTPADVALLAASWLAEAKDAKILDVGSGVGKFCVLGAKATKAQFVGVESDASFHAAAEKIRRDLKIERLRFFHGDGFQLDWSKFTGIFFYNPFSGPEDLFVGIMAETIRRLEALVPGTRIATYYGFGGEMPRSYTQVGEHRIGTGLLSFWLKG